MLSGSEKNPVTDMTCGYREPAQTQVAKCIEVNQAVRGDYRAPVRRVAVNHNPPLTVL